MVRETYYVSCIFILPSTVSCLVYLDHKRFADIACMFFSMEATVTKHNPFTEPQSQLNQLFTCSRFSSVLMQVFRGFTIFQLSHLQCFKRLSLLPTPVQTHTSVPELHPLNCLHSCRNDIENRVKTSIMTSRKSFVTF